MSDSFIRIWSCLAKIKFGEELGTTQFIQEVINDRNGKNVFDGEFIESEAGSELLSVP
jgi:hypothetical protein